MAFVIIVDDRATNRSIFSRLASFLDDDVEVEVFSTPEPALKAIDQKTPDLVITDYKMPQMTGASFTHQIRALPNGGDVPIIVITAYDDRAFRLEALEAGATDFVQTPIDHQEFITRARNLLKIGSRQRQIRSRADALAEELAGVERTRQASLRASREELAQVIDTLPATISARDRHGTLLFSNAHHGALFGGAHAAEGATGSIRSQQLDGRIFATGLPLPAFEEEITDTGGLERVLLTTKTPLKDSDGDVTGVLTTSLDITERKRAEKHLHYLAHHDVLTGLPNRHSLSRQLEDQIDQAKPETPFALHFLDLDRFKTVSHAFGYASGELLLQAVAQRIKPLLKQNALLGRLGGDEFAILQTGLDEANASAASSALAETIRASFDQSFVINGQEIHTSASIGTALFPQDGLTAEALMQHADLAMYQAKARGRNRVCRFEPALQTAVRRSAQLEVDLRAGLARNELILHYQPQVDTRTLQIVGAEALLRWQPDDKTLIFPDHFLGMAEEAGLMTEISRWVLDSACRQAAAWERRGMPIRVGINLSASLFQHLDVGALVQAAIRRAEVSPRLIDLELTETTLLDDHQAAREQIMRLQADGVSFCVDDFGTGYASFDYIERLKVNGIKIDQGFVHSLTMQPESLTVIRAIIGLGHAFGIRVIAEGVEREDQLAALQQEGCDEVQGYLFSRPLPAAEFEAFAATHAIRTAKPV